MSTEVAGVPGTGGRDPLRLSSRLPMPAEADVSRGQSLALEECVATSPGAHDEVAATLEASAARDAAVTDRRALDR
eukprot:scaffold279218_cov30-Tisochrysis_lutea.AAC.6